MKHQSIKKKTLEEAVVELYQNVKIRKQDEVF